MNISIIGTGYVGLVTGVCLAHHGHHVTCVDVDETKVDALNKGRAPIYEEGLDTLLQKVKDHLTATTDIYQAIQETDLTFICVGTPSQNDGRIDLTYVQQATIDIAKALKHKNTWHLVIVKSTVIPGTTENEVLPLLEQYTEKKKGSDFGLAMNPEFLREGVAINDFLHPDRIVIGTSDTKSASLLKKIYSSFSCPIIETSLSAAEMIKYASNAFLATKISFINEIGNLCKQLTIDTYEVADGMGLDKRIERSFLNAGIGWGGSCFPKDVHALIAQAKQWNETTPVLDAAVKRNELQPLKMVALLKKHIPNLKGKTIGILGLAFKPNTDDIRESRVIPIVEQLIKEKATIKVFDPKAMSNFQQLYPLLIYCSTAKEVLESDAVLLTTAWSEFSNLDFSQSFVIDGRRFPAASKAKQYEGVCW